MLGALEGAGQSDSSGVYMNVVDFHRDRLSYGCDCRTSKHSIKTGSVFNNKFLSVTIGSQRFKVPRDSIYGYRTCDRKTYRIFEDKDYRVVSTVKIYLYYSEAEFNAGLSASIEDRFFFSVTAISEIHPLTKAHLKTAYHDYPKFLELMDKEFQNDTELHKFDKVLKKYRLVSLFEKSL